MVVLDSVRHGEASCSAKIAVFQDDSFGQHDTGMRFGAANRILDWSAFELHVVAASNSRVDAIPLDVVTDRVGAMNLWPRPGQDPPRSARLSCDERFDRLALVGVSSLVDQDEGLAISLVDCSGPVDVDGEA